MTEPSFLYQQTVPELLGKIVEVNAAIGTYNLDAKLKHLVELRASQINQCAFCVDMHSTEARRDGETNQRLERLVVWRHVKDFTDAERAALDWTEALTNLHDNIDLAPIRAALKLHFDEAQIGALTVLVGQINIWNRIQRSVY